MLIKSENLIFAVYKYLNFRKPDEVGYNNWISFFESQGASVDAFIKAALTSEEFKLLSSRFTRAYFQDAQRFTNDHSQHGEFLEVLRILLDRGSKHKVVVDVGANGRERSNSYDLLKYFGWRGLLVEANPNLINQINDEFEGLDFELVSCAVSDEDGDGELALGVNSDISSLSSENTKSWGPLSGGVSVKIRTLHSILAEYNIPFDFDLLSIDIEGFDARVVNDLILRSSFRPEIIIMEGSMNYTINDPRELGVSDAVCAQYEVRARTVANLIMVRN